MSTTMFMTSKFSFQNTASVYLASLLLVVVAYICSSCATGQLKINTKHGITKDNVRLEASVRASNRFGQPIMLTVTLINNSHQTVTYGEINLVRELRISVVDSKKQSPQITQKGARAFGTLPWDENKFVTLLLVPGKRHVWQVDLNPLFEFAPGRYFVSTAIEVNPNANIYHPLPARALLTVDNIKFTIR